ncbi:hypothetical protein ECZU51_41480 [Escherichia coli]|nr:hypothetical protein ECZU51_41480 [Escherichia coli]
MVTDEVHQRTMERIIWPTVKGMAAEGNTYTGFLYAGLMIDKQGNPKVIEFNCRFGDPETQPIMLRMKSDLVELCLAACEGKLDEKTSEWDERASRRGDGCGWISGRLPHRRCDPRPAAGRSV